MSSALNAVAEASTSAEEVGVCWEPFPCYDGGICDAPACPCLELGDATSFEPHSPVSYRRPIPRLRIYLIVGEKWLEIELEMREIFRKLLQNIFV